MKKYELSTMCIPEYHEFSVGKMYGELRDDKAISQYLPDYNEGQFPDEDFFHKLECSLYLKQMNDLINQAHKHRAVNANDRQQEMIEIKEGISKEIMESITLLSKWRNPN